MTGPPPPVAVAEFEALGTTVVVAVTRHSRLACAVARVADELRLADRTYSRFRPDSELMRLAGRDGRPTVVSPLLAAAVSLAVRAAAATDGLVDPTVGGALVAMGYDRDFAELAASAEPPGTARPAEGAQAVSVDTGRSVVRVPSGVLLDLGATGKALAADRAATAAAAASGCGVLVNLGGDIRVAGTSPSAGWAIGIADDHRAAARETAQTVAIRDGAIATSSVVTRRWTRAGASFHHILDPTRGRPAEVVWRTVSVSARTCVAANTASTAAIVAGSDAIRRLLHAGLAARLVAIDGAVVTVGGWPGARPQAT